MANNPQYSKIFYSEFMNPNYDIEEGFRLMFVGSFDYDWGYNMNHNIHNGISTYTVTIISPDNNEYVFIIRILENGIQLTTHEVNARAIGDMEDLLNYIVQHMEDEERLRRRGAEGGRRRRLRKSRKARRHSSSKGRKHAKKTYKRHGHH